MTSGHPLQRNSFNSSGKASTWFRSVSLALSLCSNLSQRCSVRLRSGLCTAQSRSSTPNSLIHVFMDLALCTGAHSCWNRKGPSLNYSHKVGSMELSNISWCAEAFSIPFTGTKGPSPAPEEQPHTSSGNCQTQIRPSGCQIEKRDSSLQKTCLHCSRVQWRRALHHCIQHFALHLLMYGWMQLLGHENSFHKALYPLFLS